MDERSLEKIKKYLQDAEAQERIRQSMQRGRLEATVTIGRVARLFDLKESKLRDWETRGLLNPLRSKDNTGQRQYSPNELDKLAIIKELIDEGGFGPADIPDNIDNIWKSLSGSNGQQAQTLKPSDGQVAHLREVDLMPIDKRVNNAYYRELFWRYYVSHALRLSLMLICEDVNFTRAALILPLHKREAFALIHRSEDLPKVGESLVGWLGRSRSFYTLLSYAPTFQYPSDFVILPLKAVDEDLPQDNTLVAVPREDVSLLSLNLSVVETIRRLLEPLYYEVPDWHLYLGHGMRDLLDPLIDFGSGANLPDTVLTGLTKRVVRLGGKTNTGDYKWRFCCILVPDNVQLPLQHRSLIVRARSRNAPPEYKIGTTIVSPIMPVLSLNLRAFQSGQIVYRHRVTAEDTSVVHRELEEPIGSAIAVPVGGEDGSPLAVLYIVSAQPDAFSEDDKRVLRMIGRMVEELLMTYDARMQVIGKFPNLIKQPGVVDPTFGDFASENDFISDVEDLLNIIRGITNLEEIQGIERQYTTKEAVSFIAIDIDKLTSLAIKFGDRMAKNLSRVFGKSIQVQLSALFTNPADCKLYHVYADRYYLLLNGISLQEAREKAELLRKGLQGSYQVDALRSSIEQLPLPDSMLVPSDITLRLGVGSYTYLKLQEILQRYPAETANASTAALIAQFLDGMLRTGQDEEGNVIISWDPQIWGWMRWMPAD